MSREETERVANALVTLLEAGDESAADELYAPDLLVWYATLNQEASREQALASAGSLSKDLPGFHYEDIQRLHTDEGFVQHHTVCGQTKDGTPFRVPACWIVTVRDGQLAYVREYWDSAQDPRN